MRLSRNIVRADAATVNAAIEQFRGFLRGRALRVTEVREAIVRAVLLRGEHFSVEELVLDLRGQGIDASRATVYRALPLLMEAGIVQPTMLSGDRRSYEAAFGKAHHDHLICSGCGKVVEFHFEAFEMLQRDLAAKYGFRLTAHFHELIGLCGTCQHDEARRAPADGERHGAH